MRQRLASIGVAAVVIAALSLVSVSLAGQAPKPVPAPRAPAAAALDKAKASLGKAYTQSKTAWGDPDLQGIWSYATFTRPWKIGLPLYRRVEPHAQLGEYLCVEFADELMYGQYSKQTSK